MAVPRSQGRNRRKQKNRREKGEGNKEERKGRREDETQSEEKLRSLVASFPPRRPEFESKSGRVGFVVDKGH
jgi:hypothetical protein